MAQMIAGAVIMVVGVIIGAAISAASAPKKD